MEGVGDKFGTLVAGDVVEPELGREARGNCGAGGATGGAGLAGVVGVACCRWAQWLKPWNRSPIVQEFGHCIFLSSQESVDVCSLKSSPQLFLLRCSCH